MTDAVLISAITGGATLAGVLINAVVTWHVKKVVSEVKQDVSAVKENVQKVETQTNSIKDQLVATTAKASHAEGVEFERARAATEAGAIALSESKGKP